MSLPFELLVALRYTRAGRRGRRKDGFMSFISGMSVASIALGVMALIIVLSVMNGFQKEVRDRMLSVLSHIEVVNLAGPVDHWAERTAEIEKRSPEVIAGAPFVSGQALLSTGSTVRGAMVRGIDPAAEPKVSDLAQAVRLGRITDLKPGKFQIILGQDLARALGAMPGDKVTLIVPKGNMTPAGFVPRMKQMTVAAVVQSGHYEFDSTLALMHVDDAAVLYRTGGPTGIRLKIADLYEAPKVASRIGSALPAGWYASDWTMQNRTWFAAVQVEKRMMAIILFLIVLVGAFGLISTLVMTVTEKQSDIAILRTLGASARSIQLIFMIQGAVVGFVGVACGVGLGLAIAMNLDVIVPAIESALGVQFLPKEIYFISSMPSDPRASDIVPIALLSFLMSLAATIYPSWRAARIHPAEALRYE
ncbi:MAG: lipoprotein-releasing ABC transporter permease subunit [Duodenibacillus sp.]|nr:lipoprotein-releasing ABC transporter permease subunit [Duodenibacillus sp.]